MPMPGWTKNFGLATAAAGRGSGPAGESAYRKAQIADREQSNAKVFEEAQARFGDLGQQRLLMNSEGFYYLPATADPRRAAVQGDTEFLNPYAGPGMGVGDTQSLQRSVDVLGIGSGIPQADMFDTMMNRARGAIGIKGTPSRVDRMTAQHEQGYNAFDRAARYLR